MRYPRTGQLLLACGVIAALVSGCMPLTRGALVGRYLGQTPLPDSWEAAGFGGAGNFLGVYFDASQAGVVYATSDVAGVYRSTDDGDTWAVRSRGLGNYEISSFAIDPHDPQTLYAGIGALPESEKAGIYVSHDAGMNWHHLDTTFAHRIAFRKYRTANAIALDPSQQGVIISGSRDNGIWRSEDQGQSWVQVYQAPSTRAAPTYDGLDGNEPLPQAPYPAHVSAVAFDPGHAGEVYAGLDGAGVVKSVQGGIAGSWKEMNGGLPAGATVKSLAVGPAGVIYLAVGRAGVYKSIDRGGSWQEANGTLPLNDPLCADQLNRTPCWVSWVAVDPTNADIAYLTLVTYEIANVWKTGDGGVTWTALAPEVPWAPSELSGNPVAYDSGSNPTSSWSTGPALGWQVVVNPLDPDQLFFTDFWRLLRSDDGGVSWTEKVRGAQNTCVTDLLVDPEQPNVLYASHWDAGLLKSSNRGDSWQMVLPPNASDEDLDGHYWRVAVARDGNTRYFYATSDPWNRDYGQVLRSEDGVGWQPVFRNTRPCPDCVMQGLAIDPRNPSTLFVTQTGGQVFRSTRHGEAGSWAPTAGQPGNNSFSAGLAVDEHGTIFVGTSEDGLWMSDDGGASWQRFAGSEGVAIYGILTVPGAVYVAAEENLYRSLDGGEDFDQLTAFSTIDRDGLSSVGTAVAVDPNDPRHIFFGREDFWHSTDAGTGVVESLDGGASWNAVNDGLQNLSIRSLAMAPDGTLYAGTRCAGVWRRKN